MVLYLRIKIQCSNIKVFLERIEDMSILNVTNDINRTIKLDSLIGKIRIVIFSFVIFIDLLSKDPNLQSILVYIILFIYSSIWLLFQTQNSSRNIGKLGYFHLVADLVILGALTILSRTHPIMHYDGIFIIFLLIYLVRFGKIAAIFFGTGTSAIALYLCVPKHFIYSASNIILIGTVVAVIYFVGNILAIEAKSRQQLKHLSTHDELTGLYNFRFFQDQLSLEVERSKRYKMPFSMAVMDIDDFKKYNDSFGHDCGNVVLQSVAQVLNRNCRNSDWIARFGGEEFVLLMPNTDKSGAAILLERIRKNISEHQFPNRHVTISIGLTTYPVDAQTKDSLFSAADRYLYKAKSDGKNCLKYG